MGQYKHHVCTSGKHPPDAGSKEVHETIKKGALELGLKGIVRINHGGCMNQSGDGPMVVVSPEDVWYAGVDREGAVRILEEHLVGGRPVDALRHVAPPGDNKLVD